MFIYFYFFQNDSTERVPGCNLLISPLNRVVPAPVYLLCLQDPKASAICMHVSQTLNPPNSNSPEEQGMGLALFCKHRIEAQKSKVICSKPRREPGTARNES